MSWTTGKTLPWTDGFAPPYDPGDQFPSGIAEIIEPFTITISGGSTTGTHTIAATNVALDRCYIAWNHYNTSNQTTDTASDMPRMELTSATTVTATRSGTTGTVNLTGYVVQLRGDVLANVQRGTITISATATSNTATVTSVDLARSAVMWCGISTTNTGASDAINNAVLLDLTDPTTITASRTGSTGDVTISYFLLEFMPAAIRSIQDVDSVHVSAVFIANSISNIQPSNTLTFWRNHLHVAGGSYSTFSPIGTIETSVFFSTEMLSAGSSTVGATLVEFVDGIMFNQTINTATVSADSLEAGADLTFVGRAVDRDRSYINYRGNIGNEVSALSQVAFDMQFQTDSVILFDRTEVGNTLSVYAIEVPEFR